MPLSRNFQALLDSHYSLEAQEVIKTHQKRIDVVCDSINAAQYSQSVIFDLVFVYAKAFYKSPETDMVSAYKHLRLMEHCRSLLEPPYQVSWNKLLAYWESL